MPRLDYIIAASELEAPNALLAKNGIRTSY